MPVNIDTVREWFSNFGSGLEQLWDALQHEHSPKTKKAVRALSVRCLILQTILNIIGTFSHKAPLSAFNQLFYPTIFFFRYLKPDPWDRLFMGAVQSLGCSERSDIVAKPNPGYFIQLRQYCRRTFKAYIGIRTIQWLLNQTSIFSLPSLALGLMAVHQFLRSKGVAHSLWKLLIVAVLLGPRWPVWAVQTYALQQLFMYELLQPYLARVNFKGWEERAWLSQYEVELYGFAFGAWLICSIPWVGVAAIPYMFPAVAFLLARSCGSMENSGQTIAGDVIERRNPGVKAVAHGENKSAQGDWEAFKVKTFIRNDSIEAIKPPRTHDKHHSQSYSYHQGIHTPSTPAQIQVDKELCQTMKLELYKEAETAGRMREPFINEYRRVFFQGWDPRFASGQFMQPNDVYSTLTQSPSSAHANDSSAGSEEVTASTNTSQKMQAEATLGTTSIRQRGDFTQYDFSDRKTVESAPSAPPAGAVLRPGTVAGEAVFRTESAIESSTFVKYDSEDRPIDSEFRDHAHEQRTHAHEERKMAKKQRRAAKEMARTAKDKKRLRSELTPASKTNNYTSEATDEAQEAQNGDEENLEDDEEYTEDEDNDEDVLDTDASDSERHGRNILSGFGRNLRGMHGWGRAGRGHRGNVRGDSWGFRGRGSFFGRGWNPRSDGDMRQRAGHGRSSTHGGEKTVRGRGHHSSSSSQRGTSNIEPVSTTNGPKSLGSTISDIVNQNMHQIEAQLAQQIEGWAKQFMK
ncbi:hypothetical protein BGX28_009933 [Mortierella sp. GBA30]|nr:hypothetical protein BGX28_009933 [Mortierella sp. GBA30]